MLNIVNSFLSLLAVILVNVNALSRLFLKPFSALRLSPPLGDNQRKTVCIVGGGFGGLYSAINIGIKSDAQTDVYLIDPKENFVFLPLLYELAVGTASRIEVAPRYTGLLSGSKVRHIRGKVLNIDCVKKTCTIESCGDSAARFDLSFDQLVIAAGIQPRSETVKGASENALSFYTVDDAMKLKETLRSLKARRDSAKINVSVIGGGYGGVEVAANIAEFLGPQRSIVTIVDRNDRLLSPATTFNRKTAERVLLTKGVTIMHDTSVDSVDNGGLQLRDRNTEEQVHLPADLVIFTAGTEPNSLINSLPLSKDKYGRILTKRTLQTVDYPYIYALGDCSSVDDDSIPATAQVAMQQTSTAACNVVESIRHSRIYGESTESLSNSSSGNGTRVGDGAQIDGDTGDHTPHRPKLQEFRYFSLGEMLSLGDTNATITSLGGWVTLSGPVAALGRRAAYAFRMPTLGQTVTALISAGAVTSGKLLSQRFSSNEKE